MHEASLPVAREEGQALPLAAHAQGSNGQAPRRARPRDVRGVGFPSSGGPTYGGRCLNALSREVEIPYPTIEAQTRRRVEEFIGCTIEQSYSEFTVELKNGIARMLDDIANVDQSRPARHRRGPWARKAHSRRVA